MVYGRWADGKTHPDIWDISLHRPNKNRNRPTVATFMDVFFDQNRPAEERCQENEVGQNKSG